MREGRFSVNREGLPFPLETLRHRYVTPFGGRSKELGMDEVGINAQALKQNTDLVSRQDRVLISILGPDHPRPLYTKKPYEVVALDERRPDALLRSLQGEAVLPKGPTVDITGGSVLEPTRGEKLVLNGVASRILGQDHRNLIGRVLRDHLGRRPRRPEA